MCGGRGTRLGTDAEKPLVRVGGRPMVDRVCSALVESRAAGDGGTRLDRVYAAVSPHTPATRAHLADRPDVSVLETPGEGYVADLGAALERVGDPALTVASDLPLLAAETVADTLEAVRARAGSRTVCVPVELKRDLGVSVDTATEHDGRRVAPTGLNVVGDGDGTTLVVEDRRLAVNVNRPRDLRVAEQLLAGRARANRS
jgi:adenosylcobinamide-phosphate guanylyltransferase